MSESPQIWDEIFSDFGSGASVGQLPCRVIQLEQSHSQNKRAVQKVLTKLQVGENLIVVNSVANLGRFRRLFALIFRKSEIAELGALLHESGLHPVRSYGVYPNLDSVSLVYELDSAAARYAETNLLTSSEGRVRKFIGGLVDKALGGPIQVEVIVVVGCK